MTQLLISTTNELYRLQPVLADQDDESRFMEWRIVKTQAITLDSPILEDRANMLYRSEWFPTGGDRHG